MAMRRESNGGLKLAELLEKISRLKHVGENLTERAVVLQESYQNLDIDVDFELFFRVYLKLQALATERRGSGAKNSSTFLKSPTSTLLHTIISESEKLSYVAHINNYLAGDEFLKKYLPIDPASNDLFETAKDGVLICKLINVVVPGTIDERAINTKTMLNPWERNENHTICLNSAKAIGCTVVNIGTQDFIEGRIQLLVDLNLGKTPQLVELVGDSKDVEELMSLPPEKILLRWMNFQLKKGGYMKTITNFSSDVKVVCTEGPERIRELIAMGASFDHGEDGNLHLTREGGHSHRRIVHAADMTGREIERALLEAVKNDPNIFVFEHHFAIDLLTCQDGSDTTCHGVDTINTDTQEVVRFISKVTLLASGGAGHIYPSTTNPLVATGDGIAMAHRADAVISNMEFVQFHPTALADDGLPIKPREARQNAFLITEAVRGDGGILYNLNMERFMPVYDERAELAPRDVVARSIDDQLKKRKEKYVLLDISHKPRENILSHFPNIAAECLNYGLDITKQPIPVVPAAHYMCGGVRAGLQGETNVRGLYVAGEVACTGLHGANRLASNSLLEALVFARRAVEPSIDHVKSTRTDRGASHAWARPMMPRSLGTSVFNNIVRKTHEVRRRLQSMMWTYVGIVRSTKRLQTAEKRIEELELEWETYLFQHGWEATMVVLEACEMRNLFCCAKLVVSSALARQESRGLHYMIDYPHVEERLRLPTVIFPSSPVNTSWSSRQLHRQQICEGLLSSSILSA